MARGGTSKLTDQEMVTLKDFLKMTRHLTNEDVADLLGIQTRTVSYIRNGRIPKSKTIRKMFEAMTVIGIPAPKRTVGEHAPRVEDLTVSEDPKPSEEPKGKLIAMTEEEEKLFRYMFRVFIEKYHTLAFDTVQVKKVVAFARTILSDELVDGILINRITREDNR